MEREKEDLMECKREVIEAREASLDQCVTSAQAWEALHEQLLDLQSKNTIAATLGAVLSKQVSQAAGRRRQQQRDSVSLLATASSIAEAACVDGSGTISKEDFIKFVLKYKNMAKITIEGCQSEVIDKIGQAFDLMLARSSANGLEDSQRLDAKAAVDEMIREGNSHGEKETQVLGLEREARETAKSLQMVFVEAMARRQAEFDLLLNDRKGRVPAEFCSEIGQW